MKEPLTKSSDSRFQSVIGSLLYIILGTHPDIAYAVTCLSQFSANPSKEHLDKALYICCYLAETRDYALIYDGTSDQGLKGYTDADWGSNPTTRRPTTGFFFFLAKGIISWRSRAQKTVVLSSTETEYMALSDGSQQAAWLQNVLKELEYNLRPILLAGDNQGSIFMSCNLVQEICSKHIDIRYHHIRDCIDKGKVEVFFTEGNNNPADMFTKNLSHTKFLMLRKTLGLEFYSA